MKIAAQKRENFSVDFYFKVIEQRQPQSDCDYFYRANFQIVLTPAKFLSKQETRRRCKPENR